MHNIPHMVTEECGVKERGAQRFMNYDALTDTQYIL